MADSLHAGDFYRTVRPSRKICSSRKVNVKTHLVPCVEHVAPYGDGDKGQEGHCGEHIVCDLRRKAGRKNKGRGGFGCGKGERRRETSREPHTQNKKREHSENHPSSRREHPQRAGAAHSQYIQLTCLKPFEGNQTRDKLFGNCGGAPRPRNENPLPG